VLLLFAVPSSLSERAFILRSGGGGAAEATKNLGPFGASE
jgi:hypothetical protein